MQEEIPAKRDAFQRIIRNALRNYDPPDWGAERSVGNTLTVEVIVSCASGKVVKRDVRKAPFESEDIYRWAFRELDDMKLISVPERADSVTVRQDLPITLATDNTYDRAAGNR